MTTTITVDQELLGWLQSHKYQLGASSYYDLVKKRLGLVSGVACDACGRVQATPEYVILRDLQQWYVCSATCLTEVGRQQEAES